MSSSLSQETIRAMLGPVSSAVIERGRHYFRYKSVIDFNPIDDVVFAAVEGSYDYDVVLSLVEPLSDENDCTCPYFEGNGVCKHLVAVLCEAHTRGVLEMGSGHMDVVEQIRQSLEVSFGGATLSLGTISDAGVKPKARSTWRERLASIAAQQRARRESPLPAGAELMYIFDPSRGSDVGQLALDVGYRVPLSDGRWSVVKHMELRRRDLPGLPTQADRQALAMLMGSPVASHHHYDYYSTQGQPLLVPDPAQSTLLDTIGPTGRCYLRRDGRKGDVLALVWDGGEPWRPQVEVEPAGSDGYRMAMLLRRGKEQVSLDEPAILTPGGVMVRDQTLSRVQMDQPGLVDWVAAERSSGQAHLRARAGHRGITIPTNEAGAMLEQLLSMPDAPAVSLPDELAFETITSAPRPRLMIQSPNRDRWEKRMSATMSVGYGDTWLEGDDDRVGVFDPEARRFIKRGRDAEQTLVSQLLGTKLKPASQYDREHAWDFRLNPGHLTDIATTLTESGWQVVADGKPYRSGAAMNLSIQSGVDWFELHGQAAFGEQAAALPDLLKALQAGSRTVLLDDGSHGLLPEDWLKRYGMLGAMGEAQDDHLRFQIPQAMLLDALLAELPGVDVDATFKQVRDRISRAGKARPKSPPRTFKGELRPYQREGLGWMHQLQKLGLGGCLADDMGLGKTVQVLSMLEARRTAKPSDRPDHPSLVVVPKSLVFNWMQEAERFTPNLAVLNHTGTDRFAKHSLVRADLDSPQAAKALDTAFHDYDLVLTTYGTLRQDIAAFKETRFDYAILDEAQAIKNHNTASAKAARLVRADHRLAVSGTPIENHLGELWSLFAFINPGMLGQNQLGKQLQSSGAQQVCDQTRQTLSQALRPYILRRTKAQVASDLPDKTEQTLYCELPPKQRKHYNQLRDHYREQLLGRIETHGLAKSKIQVLEALLRLRQAACHPGLINPQHAKADSAKLDQLMQQIQAVLDEGHKALIFSQFTQFLGLLRKRLDPLKIDYEYLDGKTRKRQGKVERFQEDPDCKLFLISLKAGGTGLNLTAADYVFLLDPWWNPAVEAQAIDRTHRIGQDKQVFAYRLIAKDTVEEKVLELQQTKRELANAIIGQDNSVLRDLTHEDLDALLA